MKHEYMRFAGLCFALITIPARAQNTFPATGNVGVGTTTPVSPLQVVGTGTALEIGEASNTSGHQLLFGVNNVGNGYSTIQSIYQGTAFTPLVLNLNGGNVGIGTANPRGQLANNSINYGDFGSGGSTGSFNWVQTATDGGWNTISSAGNHGLVVATDQTNGMTFQVSSGAYNQTTGIRANHLLSVTGAGNVGIGTTSPGAQLEVAGSVKLTAGSGASMTFQDGSVQTVAWNGVLGGGDYAESVDVIGNRSEYEPGDVLVIDPSSKGKFLKSAEAYSTAVMGIYSTQPGVIGRRQKSDKSHMKDEVPMAMVGVVPTKVTAENGAIKPGDLLVTSSKPGYAMKGIDRAQLMGAIIGKALEPLDAGVGVIEVAVSIQ